MRDIRHIQKIDFAANPNMTIGQQLELIARRLGLPAETLYSYDLVIRGLGRQEMILLQRSQAADFTSLL